MIDQLLKLYRSHSILIKSDIRGNGNLPRPVTDNRDLQAGDCFIAIKGANFDGHDFISTARQNGAAFCIGQTEAAQIVVSDSRKATALYAKLYYGDPSAKMSIFGVTGTNGKTTTSLMMYQMLLQKGIKAAWIGTLGYKILNQDFPTKHTTPDILQLNEIFKQMLDNGISHVVMEVSSHALALDRVYGVAFRYCLFTNLSRDHLDFHRDMDDYFEAKYMLFERAAKNSAWSIINQDDPYGQMILDRVKEAEGNCLSVGRHSEADINITDVSIALEGSLFSLILKSGSSCRITSPLVGEFNVDNLSLACAALLASGIELDELPELCVALKPVRGRIESVPNQHGIGVFIDYAHSPDAINNVLKSIEKMPHGRIITVFGAGGDRDKGKRPLMLKAALSYSDTVIVCDDNPRTENPDAIIRDIVLNSDWALPWWIIRDRRIAIAAAVRLAVPGDIVLICGKGHETYQEIEGIRYDFDDHLVAQSALENIPLYKEEDELILPLDPLLIKLLLGDTPQETGYTKAQYYRYVSTDSRSIKPGSVFFAIKGDSFDGNRFVDNVLADPDNMAVGSIDTIYEEHYIRCDNPGNVMAEILRKYLQMFDLFKIALTGSTGKTGTKELISQILASRKKVLKTARNENNLIGLCKTILRVEPDHHYGVFEIGTNHFGEIAQLADTIMPDAGIILNIGPSHLEYFGDENGVFKEKCVLFHRALNLRLYPADDERFAPYKNDGISVGYSPDADYAISDVHGHQQGMRFRLNNDKWIIPYKAPYYVINSAFAIALAQSLEYDNQEIQQAILKEIKLDMRMQIEKLHEGFLIVDCYNANPVSMRSALEFWHDLHPEMPHFAILGDMLELGASAEMYHRMIGAIIADSDEQDVYSVGDYSRYFQNDSSKHFNSTEELMAALPLFPKNAVILVKASHGIHLERILPRLRGEA
ncbi:MAG: UDP-N-acetylmuramoyl-L-alanyl-D-glutamate--2,6-diaminopimelate ligase [Candidatus Cloacimonadaceae bacterium]|nr:UDP-N-acetylmuramoyl-L-alanyl-D-glutamate--2,6-diaminopimelate ligase [Candidatus Cloacimonadota bacterium]